MADPTDVGAAVSQYLDDQTANTAAQARYSMATAVAAQPDFEAELRSVARRTGVPVDTVRAFPAEMKQQAALQQFDFDGMAKDFPRTAAFLAGTENAAIAHDDTENLSAVERTLNFLGKSGKALASSLPAASAGAAGVFQAAAEFPAPLLDPLEGRVPGGNPLRRVAEGFAGMRRQAAGDAAALLPKTGGDVEAGFYSGLQSMGQNMLMLPLALVNPAAALFGMAAPAGGTAYGQARDKGLDTGQAAIFGASQAAIEYATEKLPMTRLLGDLKAGTPFYRMLAHNLAAEVPGEQIATVLQDLNEWATLNPEKPFSSYVADRPGAAVQTLVATLVGVGGQVSVVRGIDAVLNRDRAQQAAVQQADQTAEAVTQLNTLAAASQVRARDGQTFEQFVASATQDAEVSDLFISAAALAQSGMAEQVAAASPSVQQQFAQALETGTDIRIPLAEYATTIAPEGFAQGLVEHLKTDPQGFSQVEAKAFMEQRGDQLQQQVEQAMVTQAGQQTLSDGREVVQADISAQLDRAKRFTGDVNQQYATLAGSFYAVQAARLGITPQEMYARYPLRIVAQQPLQGAVLNQSQLPSSTADSIRGELRGRFGDLVDRMESSGQLKVWDTTDAYNQTADQTSRLEGAVQGSFDGQVSHLFGNGIEPGTAVGVFLHEVGEHANMQEMLGGERYADLVRRAHELVAAQDPIAERADLRVPEDTPEQHRDSELLAYMIELASADNATTGMKAWLADLVAAVRAWAYQSPIGKQLSLELTPQDILALAERAVRHERGARPATAGVGRQSMPAPAAGITGTEFGPADADVKTLRTAARAWYDKKLHGTTVVNAASGREVKFGNGKKAFATSANAEKVRLFAALPEVIRSGAILTSKPPVDQTAEQGVKAYHYLEGVATLGGAPVRVGVTLREDAAGNLFYNHNPIKEETRTSEERATPANKAGGSATEGGPLAQSVLPVDNDVNFMVLEQGTGQRGSFDPSTNTIALLKGADLSTFLHEMGHFQLEVLADIAARRGAPADVVRDMDALLAWFGVQPEEGADALTVWHRRTLEEKRAGHEQFARGFEAYLFSGTAPNVELRGVFQRFRAWLLNVYRNLKALDITLTDDVRGVMDRMLSSADDIQAAEAAASMGLLFSTPEEAAQFGVEWKGYHEQGLQATQDAVTELEAKGLRDMKWLSNAKSRELKKLQKQAAGQRRDVESEVRREVMAQPVYQAWEFLTAKPAAPNETPEAVTEYRKEVADWRQKRTEAEQDAQQAERDKLYAANPEARGLQRGQLVAKNRRQIGINVSQAMLEWDQAHPEPARPSVPSADVPPEFQTGKLKTSDLRAAYGAGEKAAWRALSARGITSDTRGQHHDVVAERFGFTSGDEMVQALAAAKPPAEAIGELTDSRMLERFGDVASPEAIEAAANEAVHNAARARFVATEQAALQAAVDARQPAGTDGKGRPRTTAILPAAARQFAEQTIARLRVRDVKPAQYQAAEARAGRDSQAALRKGDLPAAALAKRNQLINFHATRAAQDARTEVDAAIDYFRRVEASPTIDIEYREQIEGLLERYDLSRSTSLRTVDRRKSLAAWVESQRDIGLEPEISPELLDAANRQSYKDMTVEELRGLRDAVRQIEKLGRLKNKLLTAKDARDFAEVKREIADSVREHARGRVANTRTPSTNLGRWFQAVKNFGAAHIKAATWARVMDGGKVGPMWEYLIRPANERGDQETTLRAEATAKLSEIMKPVLAQGQLSKGTFFPTVKRSLTRENVLAMALNTGNASNLQRLLGGEGWTLPQLMPVLDTLTAADWKAVQAIWDHFEGYRPAIAAKQRRVYGTEPAWIEPTQVVTKFGTLRGGYYPVKYDPAASVRAEEHADAEGARALLKGAYSAATTRRSFTKTRAEEVAGRPLLYTMQGMYGGVNEVIHDLSWHEWLIDANRLLKSQTVDNAIRPAYGPEAIKQLKTWRDAIAEGDAGTQQALDSALGALRQNVSAAGLSYNVMSAALQFFGASQSIARVGAGWFGKGLAKYVAHPIDRTREVNALSEFMTNRSRTRFRELNELRNRIQGQTGVRQAVLENGYVMMARMQQMVDVPTWLAGYERAKAEGHPEDRAIALADQGVIDSQGGGQTKDLSAIERGGPAQKIYTSFYSFMNTALNVLVARGMTHRSAGRAAADFFFIVAAPSMLMTLLKDLLIPGGGDDDDEKLWKKLAAAGLDSLFGLVVLGREFAEAGKMALGVSEFPRGYAGPSGLRMIGDTYKLIQEASQGEFDDGFRKAAVNSIGSAFGLPAAQINRTWNGVEAIGSGETDNPAALVFGFQR